MTKKIRAAIYSRVSTGFQKAEGQEASPQRNANTRGWEVTKSNRTKMSGAKASRPALDELMADSARRKMDVVLVWKFDRFARSVSHLLRALEAFRGLGIDFVSTSEAISTDTATGKMVFTVLGAVAELERSLIAERVKMGLQNARRKGKRLGRPPIKSLTQLELAKVKADRATGNFSLRKLAAKYGTSVWTMQQATTGQHVGYEN